MAKLQRAQTLPAVFTAIFTLHNTVQYILSTQLTFWGGGGEREKERKEGRRGREGGRKGGGGGEGGREEKRERGGGKEKGRGGERGRSPLQGGKLQISVSQVP